MNTDKLKTKIQEEWENRPIVVIMAGSAIAQAMLSAVKVANESRNSHTWKKEVKRRSKN